MSKEDDTIFALSSGSLPSGIAVIRVSGPSSTTILAELTGDNLVPRMASLRNIRDRDSGEIIDRGLVIYFSRPKSFTGQDSIEFHLHGGVAVVEKMLRILGSFSHCRMAEPGEFSRRAFEYGRLDLTEIEGLGDLVAAQTEAQRKQALLQSRGYFRNLCEKWQSTLVQSRAMIEAHIDFSDEEDVPDDVLNRIGSDVAVVQKEMISHLFDNRAGEIVRDGFRVTLTGPPNAGKSSLINALSKRDLAIVTEVPGTTRDVLEVVLNIDGYAVVVQDTAGIHHSDETVEKIGIQRAFYASKTSDLVLWLEPLTADTTSEHRIPESVLVNTKLDISTSDPLVGEIAVSSKTGENIDLLLKFISGCINERIPAGTDPVITRERHRISIEKAAQSLSTFLEKGEMPIEVKCEYLRQASHSIGEITGRVDVDGLLDVIFSEFCIGK